MEYLDRKLSSYHDDFKHLNLIRTFLHKFISDISNGTNKDNDQKLNMNSSTFYKREILIPNDEYRVRIIMPHGFQYFEKYTDGKRDNYCEETNNLWFVGFFGTIKDMIEEDVNSEIWKLDYNLCEALKTQEHIVAYLTVQVMEGENKKYFNMVLLSSDSAVDKWKGVSDHLQAVSLSPSYYDKVRIHMGKLNGGLRGNTFTAIRTTFITYTFDDSSAIHTDKHVRIWEENLVHIDV